MVVVALAFSFDFVNGFHDAANAIATIVATKVLTPIQAVTMSAIGNFTGMVFGTFIGVLIAKTIGKGIIDTHIISGWTGVWLILAVLVGAIAWDLITWLLGLPTSSSHALVGGLVGAGLALAGWLMVARPLAAQDATVTLDEAIRLARVARPTVAQARSRFEKWCGWVESEARALTSGLLEPMRKAAHMVARHLEGILGHWRHGLTTAFLEGLNSLFSATKRKARGYRSSEYQTAMLYFVAGKLEIPYYG